MKWRKLGLVYVPDGSQWWARGYAHIPTVDRLNDQLIRVYFAGLDENNYGRIGFVDLDSSNPVRIVEVGREPVLDIGELGTFDDCGVVPSCVVDLAGRKALYYIGFQRAERVPYMLFSGLAFYNGENGSFERMQKTPVLERTPEDPFSRSAPWIIFDEGCYKMWYWSCLHWQADSVGVHYFNVIKYASSRDGLNWTTHPRPCIEPLASDEYAVGRPSVVKDGGVYKMWYSFRSFPDHYAIGYAESRDGINWARLDDRAGIEKSDQGWDSQMICYPCVVDIKGQRYMFYNGNRHGWSGFGCAVLEEE